MALEAGLIFDDDTKFYMVQDVNYEITQSYDNNYKPSGNPKGGIINFTILSPEPNDLTFHEWLLSVKLKKSGQFALPIVKNIKHDFKHIFFTDAYCVGLREYHSGSNGLQVYMQITICASIIEFGKDKRVKFTNNGLVAK